MMYFNISERIFYLYDLEYNNFLKIEYIFNIVFGLEVLFNFININ